MPESNHKYDIVIVGGLGHVGLPLGIAFADKGKKVCLYDLDTKKAESVKGGVMPFIEYGAEPILKKVLENGLLNISLDVKSISDARFVIIAIGTPVDEYLNPKTRAFLESFEKMRAHLRNGQIIVIRSTVYPHTCQQIKNLLGKDGNEWHIAYCPPPGN